MQSLTSRLTDAAAVTPPRRRGVELEFRTVWRWHFYAGLFCIPFIWWLALTGSIYLFKPQIESWLDRPYVHLTTAKARIAPIEEVRAALAAVPGSVLHAYQLPREPGDAAQILVGRDTDETRVWVDPHTARVLKTAPEDRRLMNLIFHLHGELLLGDRGSMMVELAGSWAIVMIITGLFLWWPRQPQGLGGLLYPRLRRGGRLFWRDLHAVAGIWVSLTALAMLVSGLPWAASWGNYLKEIRILSGHLSGPQAWPSGPSSVLEQRATLSAGSRAGQRSSTAAPQTPMLGMDMTHPSRPSGQPRLEQLPPGAYSAINRMVPTAAGLHLAYPVLITPPMRPDGPWGAHSDAQNRPLRVSVTLDPNTAAVLMREDFEHDPWVDRIVSVGVAAHEGQLFGWPNQIINLLTASGLFLASLSAVMMWWRRRPHGVLGAPASSGPLRFSMTLLAIVVLLALLMPLLGASLLGVFFLERGVLRRIPWLRAWLGLHGPARSAV